jgi:hypothetical protein
MDEKAGVEGSLLNNLMLLFEDKTKKDKYYLRI